jgi:L-lactate utilization protein LutB
MTSPSRLVGKWEQAWNWSDRGETLFGLAVSCGEAFALSSLEDPLMARFLLVSAAFAALILLGPSAPRASAEEHPRLHAALYEMRHARTELQDAKHDFGGHREKALSALENAISQIDKALRSVGENIKGVDPGKETYRAYANHPHIRHALHEAREARAELKNAAHDFKGHREKAVEALDRVIDQLDKALEFAK